MFEMIVRAIQDDPSETGYAEAPVWHQIPPQNITPGRLSLAELCYDAEAGLPLKFTTPTPLPRWVTLSKDGVLSYEPRDLAWARAYAEKVRAGNPKMQVKRL